MRDGCLRLLVVASLILASCVDPASTPTSKITVDLTEFAFTPKTLELPVGQKVALELVNKGSVEHDLVIDRIGLRVIFKPGQTATRFIGPFPAGTEHEIYCSLVGHKESGMTGKLVVR